MNEVILKMVEIGKSYPGVRALDHVDFEAKKGEVHALMGENGAGKSTLMKVLNGVITDYEGEIFIKGKKVNICSPTSAQNAGVSIIFQEFNLVNTLSVAENIFLGRLYGTKAGLISWVDIFNNTKELLKKVGLDIDPKTKVKDLSVAEKQMVEIAKALSYNSEIIVMDEPSATLTKNELDNLFKIIFDLKSNGVTVIYISHRLEEIFEICDSITILRDGRSIKTCSVKEIDREGIIEGMVGRSMEEGEYPERPTVKLNEVIMEVNNLNRKNVLKDISFRLHKGEILGLAGLVGAGRTELVRAIFGADKIDSGEIKIKGKKVKIKNPIDAKRNGMALLTEDRKQQGLVLKFSIKSNISITKLKKICKKGLLSKDMESKAAAIYVDKLLIKTPSSKQKALNLSGGNQQKVVIGKWLFADSEILFLDEPTRGIDVGAKYEIYCIMNELIKEGKSIIMISSEMPEVIAMSDRIIVMHEGQIKGEISKDCASPEKIMEYAICTPENS
ncbi:sugar ABC transporter ATP-binding protein [Clostridium thailandense]|uniref:Sugar ABC transporter ATP-binding protein n=1 Tax=Clostridium thailandense TaxID=2794346 RepID=A0A949U0D6_9CLOT|nr:sugar ABC transporter ATP-binding protein [Clostridium thailandense]MBV7273944.1 sugar ABC transporter ATP-binding protein [Clostridium thailandense]